MITNYSSKVPERVVRNGVRKTLNYNILELSPSEIQSLWNNQYPNESETPADWFVVEHKYMYNSVTIGGAKWKYDEVVSAIIRDKYREDEMEAITNNLAAVNAMFFQTLVNDGIVGAIQYLRDSYKSDDTERFKEMQEWRALAKKEAKEVFNIK